jgi:hypothetical protein
VKHLLYNLLLITSVTFLGELSAAASSEYENEGNAFEYRLGPNLPLGEIDGVDADDNVPPLISATASGNSAAEAAAKAALEGADAVVDRGASHTPPVIILDRDNSSDEDVAVASGGSAVDVASAVSSVDVDSVNATIASADAASAKATAASNAVVGGDNPASDADAVAAKAAADATKAADRAAIERASRAAADAGFYW